ncbi:MAG: quinoprotein dehydrogenase-associated putative ABC transporter substrate-binding protein [Rhodospirillaceae bacterium]|nr:quinoprotein dehydrogenase-associated putative ABC transporter substrate-binding protein [Rhodospirillaceae bacterium]
MRRPHPQAVLAAALLALGLGLPAATAHAAGAEAVDHSALRVCADPNDLPFSNDKGEGFENRIAELVAAELGVPVRYTWYPDAPGLVRNTLNARLCDLIIGTISGSEMVQNTNPYYRSTFALVYRTDAGLSLSSLDDPALQTLSIGVVAGTPPATLMARRGLLGHMHSYALVADTRYQHPAQDLVHDVAAGKIDVGVVWGPIAGYFGRRENPPLAVVPLAAQSGPIRLDYRITMGVRHNEPEWKHQIDRIILKKQKEIDRILLDYGVPLLDEQGKPIGP